MHVKNIPTLQSIINGLSTICENATEIYSVALDTTAVSYTWILPNGWVGNSNSNSITANATTTGGIVSVTATNSCGTSTALTLQVNVTNVPPLLDPIQGSAIVCEGSTVTYTVPVMQGAAAYTWSLPLGWSGTSTTNSINVVPTAGLETISVTALNGCGNSAPQSYQVQVNALPNVTLDLTPIAIQCLVVTQLNLVGGLPAGGTYAGSTVTAGVFSPNIAGVGAHVIQYQFTDNNTCTAFAYDTITVTICTAINESLANSSDLNAYPNPGNGIINIIGTKNVTPCDIYNAAGIKVKSINLIGNNNTVDLTELANGLYLLKIQHEGKLKMVKYIKQ